MRNLKMGHSPAIYPQYAEPESRKAVGLNECCRTYEIPKSIFKRHLMGKEKRDLDRPVNGSVNGRNTVISLEIEEELIQYILMFEEYLSGLTIKGVRKLAFDVLEANPHLPNQFNKEIRLARKRYYYGFMKRHPNLSLRQLENVSVAQSIAAEETERKNFKETNKKTNKLSKRTEKASKIIDVDVKEEDWFHFIFEEAVIEDMISCSVCNQWVNETYAGVSTAQEVLILSVTCVTTESDKRKMDILWTLLEAFCSQNVHISGIVHVLPHFALVLKEEEEELWCACFCSSVLKMFPAQEEILFFCS
ncbi:hypothetical protein ANN_06759 [Periplaneta americana]|uniref:Uncharacterized protein n=1 Tax=Periplaneta americana TaxID=6978 RepID=A0ABQ8TGY8_PERAM|nr:hypothetical protein ANN_06759 [Periplaneta americana]